jgi:hypothetical protein
MHTMGEVRDMFAGLGWEKDIRNIGDPYVPFTPLPKYDIGVANRNNDNYKLTPFLQFTQAWRWKVQEEQKRYAKNESRRADVLDKNATRGMNGEANQTIDLNENKSFDMEEEVNVVGEFSMSLLFHEKMKI